MIEEKKSNSSIFIAAVVGILIILVIFGGVFLSRQRSIEPTTNPIPVQGLATVKVSLPTISTPSTQYSLSTIDGESANDFMVRLQASNQGFSFATKDTSYGPMLITVNGYTADDAKHEFWLFNVNGKSSDVGIADYKIKSGDSLEFVIAPY